MGFRVWGVEGEGAREHGTCNGVWSGEPSQGLGFVVFFRLSFVLCIHFVWIVALVLISLLLIIFVEILEPCRLFV